MNVEDAEELVKEYFKDDGTLPATLYLPKEKYSSLIDNIDNIIETPVKIKGVKIAFDGLIKDPVVLSDNFGDIPEFLTDPPEEKIKELIEIEKSEYEDHLRGRSVEQYKTSVFLEPFCVWQRFDEDKIEEYGHPTSNPDLEIRMGEETEFTKSNFDEIDRVKFGFENSYTYEMEEALNDESAERSERKLAKAIHDTLWDVRVDPVYAERTWSYELPQSEVPTVDGEPVEIEHSEQIKIGEKYTTYKSLFMRKLDGDFHKLQLQ